MLNQSSRYRSLLSSSGRAARAPAAMRRDPTGSNDPGWSWAAPRQGLASRPDMPGQAPPRPRAKGDESRDESRRCVACAASRPVMCDGAAAGSRRVECSACGDFFVCGALALVAHGRGPHAGAGDLATAGATARAPSAVYRVHAGQRPARDPASRRQRAGGRRQRLVSRRVGQREARPHRVCAPVRAPDVRGLEERARRRVRHMARGGRRQQQRLDEQPIGPTTTSTFRRTRSTSRCSSNRIAWAICSTR